MQQFRSVTSLITGATVGLVSCTALFVVFALQNHSLLGRSDYAQTVAVVMATTVSSILVMSLLHGGLEELYNSLRDSENRAIEAARRDALTGLNNRKGLLEELETGIARSAEQDGVALLFLDLDHFKRVNDTLGHSTGDELIRAVADRVRAWRKDAISARLGGDEFAIIIDVNSSSDLAACCQEIRQVLSARYLLLDCHNVRIDVSIGATFIEHLLDTSEHMRRADIAMYLAKATKAGFKLFDERMLREVERKTLVEERLRATLLAGNGLGAVLQPQVNRRGEIVAFEGFLRWTDQMLGEVPVTELVQTAVEAHLMSEVGLFMAEQACLAALAVPHRICLNVAVSEVLAQDFAPKLLDLTRKHGLSPDRLQLEVTESAFVERAHELEPILARLSDLGFSLAVDNFGTSTSSLSYLKRLHVDTIKLDRTLLESTRLLENIGVMRAIVRLAKSLGLSVVCGGVSDSQDQTIALQAGCDLLQGHFVSTPMPVAAFTSAKAMQRTAARRWAAA